MTDELPARLGGLIELARNGGSADVGTFTMAELRAAGLGGPRAGQPEGAEAPARAVEIPAGLKDVRALFVEHSRMLASWTLGPRRPNPITDILLWRISVVNVEPFDVALVQILDGVVTDGERLGDGDVVAQLWRVDQLAERLADLAYRAPAGEDERAASPGTEAIFTGPDRKAVAVPTRLLHEWDAPRAKMIRWAYSLVGRRDSGDWIARRPMTLRRITRERYRDHLIWRLGKSTPSR